MADIYPKVKVAAVQAASVFLNRDATIKKSCNLIKEAGKNGAKIIVFPETFIPAFPFWYFFYPAGDPRCKVWNRELFKNSVVVPSKETDELCLAAKEADVYVVMGINEKEPNSMGTMYNTQLFIHPDGYIMGKHRKLVPTYIERLVHCGGDGSTLNVFDTKYGKLGGLICGENMNSLARFVLLQKGECIHAASWPCHVFKHPSVESALIRMKNYAFEGKTFVISSSWIFSEEMKEILCLDNYEGEMAQFGGHATIIDPFGEYVTEPLTNSGETIVYGEIDLEEIIDAKIRHDITGHYNRFDIFTLKFNSKKQNALEEYCDTENDKIIKNYNLGNQDSIVADDVANHDMINQNNNSKRQGLIDEDEIEKTQM